MKRVHLAMLVVLVLMLALAAPTMAAPPGKGLETFPATCAGQEDVVTVSAGSSFWFRGQHYLVTVFSGTFTPVEGDPEPFTQTFGKKKGLAGTSITCMVELVFPGEGSLSLEVTAVAVPPRS
jgi:hypothetical protein